MQIEIQVPGTQTISSFCSLIMLYQNFKNNFFYINVIALMMYVKDKIWYVLFLFYLNIYYVFVYYLLWQIAIGYVLKHAAFSISSVGITGILQCDFNIDISRIEMSIFFNTFWSQFARRAMLDCNLHLCRPVYFAINNGVVCF